jgi:hypothetical protein
VVKNSEKMGRRKLAYTVRKFNDGFYVLLTIEANGAVVAELERRLRVTEQVIKFITVRMDEEEKRLAKVARGHRAEHQEAQRQPLRSRLLLRLHLLRKRLSPLLLLLLKPKRRAGRRLDCLFLVEFAARQVSKLAEPGTCDPEMPGNARRKRKLHVRRNSSQGA